MPDKSFTNNINSLLFTIKGSFHGYNGNYLLACKNFSQAFSKIDKKLQCSVDWISVIKRNFHDYCAVNKETLLNGFSTNSYSHDILENAWIQWGTLNQNIFHQSRYTNMNVGIAALKCYVIATTLAGDIKCNILIARVCMKLLLL